MPAIAASTAAALGAHRRHRAEIAFGRRLQHEAAARLRDDQELFEIEHAGGVSATNSP